MHQELVEKNIFGITLISESIRTTFGKFHINYLSYNGNQYRE